MASTAPLAALDGYMVEDYAAALVTLRDHGATKMLRVITWRLSHSVLAGESVGRYGKLATSLAGREHQIDLMVSACWELSALGITGNIPDQITGRTTPAARSLLDMVDLVIGLNRCGLLECTATMAMI